MRSNWNVLPESVTKSIAGHVGGPFDVEAVPDGDHAEIAAAVTGPAGKVFVKAASADLGVRSLRYEVAATRSVGRYAPAVLWDFESDGWLVVGTEHLDGPHPDLSPGSPDLHLLAEVLKRLQTTVAPEGNWYSAGSRLGWEQEAASGEMLVHSDLNPANLIMTADGLRVVDWAYTTRAASWVELALIMQWLIGSGHAPEQAEDWLTQFPAWAAVDPAVLDDFAARSSAKWSDKARPNSDQWVRDLSTWTTAWATYRRERG